MHLAIVKSAIIDSPYAYQTQTTNANYPQDIKVETSWNNDSNDAFFTHFSHEVYNEFLFNAGLETDCDIELILPFIKINSHILEVGAGYGRSLDPLLKHLQSCTIDAVEKNTTIFKKLQRQYDHVNRITLHNKDIFEYLYKSRVQYDAILVLWSTLATFCPKEQSLLIKQLYDHLHHSGCIFID